MSWLETISKHLPSPTSGGRVKSQPAVGDVGYRFRKLFDDGWYEGVVSKIRMGAMDGKDRRCVYSDGDSEDLSLKQLQALALVDPQVTKKKPVYPVKSDVQNCTKKQKKRRRDEEEADGSDDEPTGEDSTDGMRISRSGREVKKPRKIDETYTYAHAGKTAARETREEERLSTPERKAQELSTCLNDIVYDKAAESTMNLDNSPKRAQSARSGNSRVAEEQPYDRKEWLQMMAASLGADTSRQQRRGSKGGNRPAVITAASLQNPTAKKSDASSVCSTITCSSTTTNTAAKPPPEAVLVAHSPTASVAPTSDAPLSLLSDRDVGKRHGCLVYHKNDSKRRVGEVLMEKDSEWVEVSVSGKSKVHKALHLFVVPSDRFKAGDCVPSGFGKTPVKRGSSSPSAKQLPPPPKPSIEVRPASGAGSGRPREVVDEVGRLKILQPDERTMRGDSHWLCKVKGCDKQGRSEIDDMCKRHYRMFRAAGRDTGDPPPRTDISRISAINATMPLFLQNMQLALTNRLGWSVNGIEDAVLCREDAAFPLGMKVRKFFHGHGCHDGRVVKCARKLHNDERPVLVYRLLFNDGDQEDALHSEVSSMRQLYNMHTSPLAPAEEQIPVGSVFQTRSGIIEIIQHKGPPGTKEAEGIVVARFNDSTQTVELDLVELQMLIVQRIGGPACDSATTPNSPNGREVDATPSKVSSPSSPSSDAAQWDVQREPLLEWPGQRTGQPEHYDVCEGLSLHRKRFPLDDYGDVVRIPESNRVNNPSDGRPGCNVGMWDPAACFRHLSWDPYATTICELCGIDENDEKVLLCSDCQNGFHTYCLRPVVVNIPKGDWLCPACRSGDSSAQVPFAQFSKKMRNQHEEVFKYLGLPFKRASEFFRRNADAMALFALNSQSAVKQRAINEQFTSKQIVFDVGNIKFIGSPHKNDWLLPTPLSGEDYVSSLRTMVAAMKYNGMEKYLVDHQYGATTDEKMNDPSLEVDKIAPMSRRNLEIFKAFRHNLMQGVIPPIEISYDEDFGFTVKAVAPLQKHTIIGEYLGEVMTSDEADHSNSDSLMLLLDTGDSKTSLTIDPTRAGNLSRFLSGINNKCVRSKRKANVRTRRFFLDDKVHICLFASKRIDVGEVLTYDYNAGNEGKDASQWAESGFYDTSNFF